MNKKSKLLKMSYERRQGLVGYLFLIPWLIGTAVFFCYPFFHTVWMSFCNVTFEPGKIITVFSGFGDYKKVFIEQQFLREAGTHLLTTCLHTICVLIISIFLAIILNQEFFSRTLWRVIFSIPIIVASGLVLSVFQGKGVSTNKKDNPNKEPIHTIAKEHLISACVENIPFQPCGGILDSDVINIPLHLNEDRVL